MERIGIRELRQHASRWLQRVAEGEAFEVTDRGRAIAILVPMPSEAGNLTRLLLEGRATAADGDLLDLGPPLTPAESPLPSEVLEALRANER